MLIVLVGLLIVAYKFIFVSDEVNLTAEENIAASERVESVLREVQRINFDTSLLRDPKLVSLKSIQVPLLSLPIGKKNPFISPQGAAPK